MDGVKKVLGGEDVDRWWLLFRDISESAQKFKLAQVLFFSTFFSGLRRNHNPSPSTLPSCVWRGSLAASLHAPRVLSLVNVVLFAILSPPPARGSLRSGSGNVFASASFSPQKRTIIRSLFYFFLFCPAPPLPPTLSYSNCLILIYFHRFVKITRPLTPPPRGFRPLLSSFHRCSMISLDCRMTIARSDDRR